jgi:hypothetical protein
MQKLKMIAILVLVFMVSLPVYGQAYTWYSYDGHSYALTDFGTWTQAQSEAQSIGANLVTINSAGENNWLAATFETYGRDHQGEIGYAAAWIGLYRDEGGWRWVNSSDPVVLYGGSPWQDGEHAYIHVQPHTLAPSWNNNSFHDSSSNPGANFRGIMEISTAPVPEPATMLLLGFSLVGLAGVRRFKK